MRDLLTELETLALKAGEAIMCIYSGNIHSSLKCDQSPVTEADAHAEEIILDGLRVRYPDIPVVAEEECSSGRLPGELGGRFFLVDPLDGTKEFINRRDEFTVNIALVENGVPVAGVVFAPALGALYVGFADLAIKYSVEPSGQRNIGKRLNVRQCDDGLIAVASRSHSDWATEAWLGKMGVHDTVSVGSSLKFCLVAEGRADVYPRFGRTMEWDTAAGHAILRAAGGTVSCLDGTVLTYGKRNQAADTDFANPHFVASGQLVIRGDSNS